MKDEEVDLEKSQTFLENVATTNVDLVVRKQGNHRLMKPRDLTLIIYVLQKLIEDISNYSISMFDFMFRNIIFLLLHQSSILSSHHG